ncbi:hypothetical protein HMPREF9554_02308 [Treponema phagedenis F0421]|nr:hypothetical protein HMPREF9554_02308 [Treponema phagedenis F0421]QSH95876.1 hypothetical protein C5O78_12800 [Treponema phagedenis]
MLRLKAGFKGQLPLVHACPDKRNRLLDKRADLPHNYHILYPVKLFGKRGLFFKRLLTVFA